jgi:hypothetical protein
MRMESSPEEDQQAARGMDARIRSLALMCHYQFIRNQSELFEGSFGIVDEFLRDYVGYYL